MGVSLEQYRARIGSYQQPAQRKMSKEKEQMVQLKKVDHDLAWKYTQVALVVLYISLCYWVLILHTFERGENSESSPFATPDYMQEGVKSLPKQYHGVTVDQLDPFSVYEIWESRKGNSSAEWRDDNPWRHATVTRTCTLLCSGDVEENPGPTIGKRDPLEILRHLLTELLSDAARTSAYQRLARHVRQSGLKFRPEHRVPKDGNCMFHAISDQLLHIDGQDITHVQLRQDIVNYLRSNPSNDRGDHLEIYVPDQDWGAYLTSMSRNGTWGDHIVLQAMATMLGRDIRIISSVKSDNYEIVLSPVSAHLTRPPLLLGHLAENHYYSLAERTVLGLKRSTSMDSLITNIPSKRRKIIRNSRLSCLDLDEGVQHFSNAPLLDLTDEFGKKTMESIRSEHVKLLQTQLKETKLQKQQFQAKLEVVNHQTDLQLGMVRSLQREVTRLAEKNEHAQKFFLESKSEIQQLKDVNKLFASQFGDLLQEKEKLASKLAMKERLADTGVKTESKEEAATQTLDNTDAAEIQQLQMEREQLELHIKRCEDTIEALHKELERDHGHKPAVNREEVEESQNEPDTQPNLNERNSLIEETSSVTVLPTEQLQKGEDPAGVKAHSSQSDDDNERKGHRHTVKLVFLGKTMAGKTSLKQTLQLQSSKLVSEDEPRTLSCEIDDWRTQETDFKTYDFGGSKDYTLAHQLFLSPQGMHLLVIDLSNYDDDAFSDHIGDWLETLYAHVPFEHFCLVGSHADKISDIECREKEIAIRKAVTNIMQDRIKQVDSQMTEIERLLKIAQTDPTLCLWSKKYLEEELDKCRRFKSIAEGHKSNLTMHIVSSKTLKGIKNLTDYLIRYASKVENQCEVKEISPHIISRFNDCLTEGNIDTCPCWITDDESRTLARQHGLDDDEQYLKVLQYLHYTGSILCYNMGKDDSQMIVFHNPAGMIDFVNVLFSGPADECRLICLPAQIKKIKTLLKQKSSLKLQQMEALLKTIYSSGPKQIPIKRLLDDVCDQYGICYPVPKHSDTKPTEVTYWFPYHLAERQPDDVTSKIQEFDKSGAEQMEVLFQMKFGRRQFFERYCANLNQLENVARTWKGGAFLWTKGDYRMPIVILRKFTHGEQVMNFSIKAWGMTQTEGKIEDTNSSRMAMWEALARQIHLLECMLYHRPGVNYGIFVVCQCSDCKTKKFEGNEEDEPHYFDFCWDIDHVEEYRDGIVMCPESHEIMPPDLVVPPTAVSNHYKPHGKAKEMSCKFDISTSTSVSTVVADGPSLLSTGTEQPTILLIIDEYSTSMGDVITINRQLAQLFIKAGANVYVVVLRASPANESCAKNDGIIELLTPVLYDNDPRQPIFEWLKYDHVARYPKLSELHVNYIIGHSYTTSLAAINIKEKQCHKAKPVLFNHTIPEDIHGHEGPIDQEEERSFLQEAGKAYAVFSVGKRVYENFETKLHQSLGDKKPKHMCFLPRPSKCFTDLKLNFADGQKRVLFFGKVTKEEKWKGHDIAAWAVDNVAGKIKNNVNLTIRGISEDEWEKSRKILNQNLHSGALNPILLPYGTQEEVCESLQQAHLVLMPSRAEPFGLVGLEAIAAGVPVLISDKSGLADMIMDLINNQKKCHPDMRHYIVNTSMNESNQTETKKKWASSIEDRLRHSESEFNNAAKFRESLLESKYWKESHQNLLQVCGLNIDLWNCLDHLCNT